MHYQLLIYLSSLSSYNAEYRYNTIIRKIHYIIDLYAPNQITKIPAKHVMHEPWITWEYYTHQSIWTNFTKNNWAGINQRENIINT